MAVAIDFLAPVAPLTGTGTVTKYPIGVSGNQEKWVYAGDTGTAFDITAGAAKGYKIPCRGESGKISEISVEITGSTDVDVIVCEKDPSDDGSTIAYTEEEVLIFLEAVNVGYSPELSKPVCFSNRGTPKSPYLYLSIAPTTGNTSTWKISITYDRV